MIEGNRRGPERSFKHDFSLPYKTLQQLKDGSPSRQHGLSEEQEERWKQSAINLIIRVAAKLRM